MSTYFPIEKSGYKFKLSVADPVNGKCVRTRKNKLPRGKVWHRLSQLDWSFTFRDRGDWLKEAQDIAKRHGINIDEAKGL